MDAFLKHLWLHVNDKLHTYHAYNFVSLCLCNSVFSVCDIWDFDHYRKWWKLFILIDTTPCLSFPGDFALVKLCSVVWNHTHCSVILKFHFLLFFTKSGKSLTFALWVLQKHGSFIVLVSLYFIPLSFCEDVSTLPIKRRQKYQTKSIMLILTKYFL